MWFSFGSKWPHLWPTSWLPWPIRYRRPLKSNYTPHRLLPAFATSSVEMQVFVWINKTGLATTFWLNHFFSICRPASNCGTVFLLNLLRREPLPAGKSPKIISGKSGQDAFFLPYSCTMPPGPVIPYPVSRRKWTIRQGKIIKNHSWLRQSTGQIFVPSI